MKTPCKTVILAQSHEKLRESVTRESFWENDFSSMPDELHYKPFDAAAESAAGSAVNSVLLPSQSCNSAMLFGPKRPISRQIGLSEEEKIVRPGSNSTRNNVLAKSLNCDAKNFVQTAKGSGQILMKRQATI